MPKVRRWAALLAIFAVLQGLLPLSLAQPALAATAIPAAPFSDVYATKYQDAVGLLYLLKVGTGTAPFTFSPNDSVTRAQMATFLLRALGQAPADSPTAAFPDVPLNHWANAIITQAAELGLIKGDAAGRFNPDAPVTFAEVATMLVRALGYEGQVPAGDWPVNYILEANQLGLLANSSFEASVKATRGEVAILLVNAIFKVKEMATGETLNARVFQSTAALSITPAGGAISGSQVQLRLRGTDWFGNSFPVSGTWSVVSGNATISPDGLLAPSGSGVLTVQASRGDLTVTQVYTRVESLAVTPAQSTVAVGATVKFTVTGLTGDRQTVPVTAQWAATGPGTIDPATGVLKATGSGTITVTASAGGILGTATVMAVGSLSITPAVTALSPGKVVQFAAAGPNGATLDTPITWSILSGGGSLSPAGEYTAGAPGHAVIQAAAGSLIAKVELDIVSGLRIQPDAPSVGIGTTQQFTAQVQTASGWQTVTPSDWSLSNASVGVLGAKGLFAATGSGTATVTARYGGLTANTTVTVAGPATALQLSATRTLLPANGKSAATLTATFVDSLGHATNAPVGQVLFTISDMNLGTLSAYSAQVVNNLATVTFTSGTLATSGTISVSAPGSAVSGANLSVSTTAPTVVGVSLTPYPATIAADGSSHSTITATLVDQDGQPAVNGTAYSVMVTLGATGNAGTLMSTSITIGPGSKSGTAQFLAAASPGISSITGVSQYPVSVAQIATVHVGPAAKLNIRTPIVDTTANGTTQMSVTVEIQDANSDIVTGDNSTVASLSVTGPANLNPQSLTLSGGTAEFHLATTKAGSYTVLATDISSSQVASATATANFVAGPPTSVNLVLNPNVDAVTADGVTAVRLQGRILDAYGNLVTTATNPVTFVQNAATVFQNIGTQTVAAAGGIASVLITPKTGIGSDQFVATASGLTGGSLTVSTRITGGANKVVVRPVTPTTTTSGQSLTVTVWVEDSVGHVVTNDSGRSVALMLSDSKATSNGPQTTVNGVATFTVTTASSGTLTIKAQSGGLLPDSTGEAISVNPAPPDHIVLAASASGLAADGASWVTITPQLVDVRGNPAGGATTVTLTLSDSRIGHLTATQISTGYANTFTSSTTPGTVTISGTSQYPVVPIALRTYISGPPTHVVVDPPQSVPAGTSGNSVMQLTVRVTDDNGNTITSLNSGAPASGGIVSVAYLTASVGTSGTSTLSTTASYPLPPGVINPNGSTTAAMWLSRGSATFTFTDTRAETVTFTPTLSMGNTLLTSVPATGTVTAGSAASVSIVSSPTAVNALTGGTATVIATVSDAYGNAIPSTGDTFTFSLNSTIYFAPLGSLTVPAGSSGATLVLQSKTNAASMTTITATSSQTGLTSAPYVLVQDFQPDKPSVTVVSTNGSANIYASDLAVQVTLYFNTRLVSQTPTLYVNGVQTPFYSDVNGVSRVSVISPGSTFITGYILRSSYGGVGPKTLTAVLQDAVGTGVVSDPVNFTVQ